MTSGFKGLLHDLMLNRMSLSIKNSWYDEQGRVYIYCTAEETLWADRAYQAEAREADQEIRIKHFTTRTVPEPSAQPELRGADLDLSGFQTSEKPISEPRQIRGLDLEKPDPSPVSDWFGNRVTYSIQ